MLIQYQQLELALIMTGYEQGALGFLASSMKRIDGCSAPPE
jgi:hypothetical protein